MHKLTNEEFKTRALEIHKGRYSYEKTDVEHRDGDGKVIITCKIHGDFKQDPINHLRGIGCPKCCGNIKRSKEEVIEDIKRVHGDKYIIPDDFEYVNNKTKLHLICKEHGDFYPTYHNLIKKRCGCRECAVHLMKQDEFIEKVKSNYNNELDLSNAIFSGYRNRVLVKCKKCGKVHEVLPKSLLNYTFKCDCVKNKSTQLEEGIAKTLDEYNIKYVRQYKSEWLKNKRELSLDFYLPEYNAAIECQGRQHFEPFNKNEEKYVKNFEVQVERDRVKFNLCKEHNIELFYYSTEKIYNYHSIVYNNKLEIIKKIINN